MTLRVYNSSTKTKEPFSTTEEGRVLMYVCGPTVYNYIHIGNARCYITFDFVKRYLIDKGYSVLHVQNFTDIDDKIIAVSKEENIEWTHLAEKYEIAFLEDMKSLAVIEPDLMPRATEHIGEMKEAIASLIRKGFAYEAEGDVFFSVKKSENYGNLSHRRPEDSGTGIRVNVCEKKSDPADFVLWKSAKSGEPFWDSPWGPGRPGWHTECAVMALKYLGKCIDIHGGGRDLAFPHHENEIAQAEALTGYKPFVRHWMHNGFVKMGSEKMSKSTGNIVLLRELLRSYEADTIRMLAIQSHYRSDIDFSESALINAGKALDRIKSCISSMHDFTKNVRGPSAPCRTEKETLLAELIFDSEKAFCEAMDDDFNTARAISVVFDLTREMNGYVAEQKEFETPAAKAMVEMGSHMIDKLCRLLGLFSSCHKPDEEKKRKESGGAEPFIELLLRIRDDARSEKNWSLSDRIRDGLLETGVRIEDTREKTLWKWTD